MVGLLILARISHHVQGLAEGRGFGPAVSAGPALSSFHAPRSLRTQAARGVERRKNQEGFQRRG